MSVGLVEGVRISLLRCDARDVRRRISRLVQCYQPVTAGSLQDRQTPPRIRCRIDRDGARMVDDMRVSDVGEFD